MTAPTRRGGAKAKAKPKPAPEPEPEATEDEVLEDEEATEGEEEAPTRKRDTTPLPSGEELYQAKYVEGMTWQEIRDNLDPRIRSPKGLALIAEYVIENGLEDEHPEFSSLQELEGEELSAAIVEAHDAGQGWSVLASRTGLKIGEVQDIYSDAGGENPGRVGGQRYGGGRSIRTAAEATEEGEATEGGEEEELVEEEEAPKPKPKGRAKQPPPPAKVAPAKPAAAKKPPPRRRQAAGTPS